MKNDRKKTRRDVIGRKKNKRKRRQREGERGNGFTQKSR